MRIDKANLVYDDEQHIDNIGWQVKKMVDMLTARLAEVEKQANAWQKKYQIRTPQEQAQQQAAAAASGGGSTGVLA